MSVVETIAARWPWDVTPDPALERSLAYLDAPWAAETYLRGGLTIGVGAGLVTFLSGLLVSPGSSMVVAVLALAGALVSLRVAQSFPVFLAQIERTRALGSVSALVGRATLRMRLEPTAERAARFAARTGDGPLAKSLDEHVERSAGTPRTGLDAFAAEWNEWFPALDRATALLTASADATRADRTRHLDKALTTVLDGTRDRMASFASTVRGPLSGVYAFGVLLPLALVGMLPAARVAGIRISVAHVVVLYDVLLPLALVGAVAWLVGHRPVAFPPPRVERSHPDVPDGAWRAVIAGIVGGVGGWFLASQLVAPWAGPVAAIGGALGAALIVRHRPVKAVRDRVHEVEANLDDALYLVGSRVSEGEAVETALRRASEEVPGATGALLADAVGVNRRLRVDVRGAFLGDHGALSDLPSPRAREAAALLGLVAEAGPPGGSALVALADNLDDLRRVEAEARRELSSVTDTLTNTAVVFGPLIGGATVALADGMTRAGGDGVMNGSLPTPGLGLAVGGYVLVLSVLLTVLSTALDRGLDRSLLGYRVGLALLTATATYLAGFTGASVLL